MSGREERKRVSPPAANRVSSPPILASSDQAVARAWIAWMRLYTVLVAAGLLRVALIGWSFYQDANLQVHYTDIDYDVFSDAARCLLQSTAPECSPAQGSYVPASIEVGDPYARATYRYTPLLAILASLNIILHPAAGKVLFALADLVLGVLLHSLLRARGVSRAAAVNYVAGIWLLNPVVANISTRGSAESVLGLMVVSVLVLAEAKRWNWAAVVFGLAVHFKIYPVIYGSSLFAAIAGKGRGWRISWEHVKFGLVSLATFMLFNASMYAIWGDPFLEHTFLYHIHRLDHRHNFSPYFYPIYLAASTSSPSSSLWSSILRSPLAAFVPQLGLSLGLGFAFGAQDLAFAWFVQTFAFVALNKVCTSQYFLWYLWLLPPVLPRLQLSPLRGFSLIAVWVTTQAIWLSQAYRLEMLGEPVYANVWAAGVVFLAANCWVLSEVLRWYRCPVAGKTKAI